MQNVKRRSFLKSAGLVGFCAGIVSMGKSTVLFAKDIVYKAADLAVNRKNPSVAALNYVADAKTSKLRTTVRSGVPADKQFCNNCLQYKEPGVLDTDKSKVGKCVLFQNQLVHGAGWCNVWVKKP